MADNYWTSRRRLTRRRLLGRTALVAAGAVLAPALAACRSSASKSTAPSRTGAAAGGTQATGEPIKVGLLLTNVGATGLFARDEQKGAELYVDQLNKAGGVNGRPILLVHYDTEGQPDRAALLFRRLAQEDKVVAVIGPDSALIVNGMSSVPREVRVLAVTGVGGVETIPEADRDWLVTAWAPFAWVQTLVMAYFKQKYKVQRLGILTSADTTGATTAVEVQDSAKLVGIDVVKQAAQPLTDRDLTPSLRDIAGAHPDAVHVIGSGPYGTIGLSQTEQVGLNVPLSYSGGNVVPALIKDIGPTAGKNFHLGTSRLTAIDTLPADDPYGKQLKKFQQDYAAAYKEPASLPAGVGYDMAETVIDAIRAVGVDPQQIRDYVMTKEAFTGVQGAKFHRQKGNIWGVDPTEMIVAGIDNGKFVFKSYLKQSFDALNITPAQLAERERALKIVTQ